MKFTESTERSRMHPYHHPMCNIVLKPAKGDEGTVDPLAVRRGLFEDGAPCVQSFWIPTEQELALLNSGGCVLLTLITRNPPPPVSLGVLEAQDALAPGGHA